MMMMSSDLATQTSSGEASGPLAELADRFRGVCRSAVDPLEVASALEFDGVSDRAARAEYDVPDVFALARLLYEQVPRDPAPPAPEPDPWRARPLAHGLLYAIPAVCFPAAGTLLVGPHVLRVLVISLLSGWGLSQGLAAVGYQRLGTSGPGPARRVLRAGLAWCLVIVAIILTATTVLLHTRSPVVLFGAGEAVYMLGACVLLVIGAERWLPAALAPGVTGATVFLILGKPASLEHQTFVALAATPVLAIVLAVVCTAGAGPQVGRLLNSGELAGAVPAIALGVIAAGLLSFPGVFGVTGHGGGNVGALVASVPLALSMGVAESSLLWYRRGTRKALNLTDDSRWFRGRASLLLLGALTQYVLGAIVLVGGALGVALLSGAVRLDSTLLLSVGGYLLLGAGMFLVMLCATLRVRLVPLTVAAATLAVELVLRHHGLPVEVMLPAALFAVVLSYAFMRLGQAVLHA
jgi:hypothetical protein